MSIATGRRELVVAERGVEHGEYALVERDVVERARLGEQRVHAPVANPSKLLRPVGVASSTGASAARFASTAAASMNRSTSV